MLANQAYLPNSNLFPFPSSFGKFYKCMHVLCSERERESGGGACLDFGNLEFAVSKLSDQ